MLENSRHCENDETKANRAETMLERAKFAVRHSDAYAVLRQMPDSQNSMTRYKRLLENQRVREAAVIHQDESIALALRQIFMLIRYAMSAIGPRVFVRSRKNRGIITSTGINGRREGAEEGKPPTGRLLITRPGNQMYVNIIKQCNDCFAHEIFITFDVQHLWQAV